jgi:Family of unknown function (DUF5677)
MDNFYKYLKENWEKNNSKIDSDKYPFTLKIINHHFHKIFSINQSILKIQNPTDLYSFLILMRSQIEHLIVFYFIWIKACIDKEDTVAKIYYEEYVLHEFLKRDNYMARQKIDPSSRYAKLFNLIMEIYKRFGAFKQADTDKIHRKGNMFEVKKISNYIQKLPEDTNSELFIIISKKRILSFLEQYNYLSSFVHGGPTADIMIKESDKETKQELIDDFKGLNDFVPGMISFLILYFTALNNESFKDDFVKLVNDFLDSTLHNTE